MLNLIFPFSIKGHFHKSSSVCDVAKVSNDDENKETGEEEKMEEKNSTIVTPTKKLISGETLNEEDLKGRSKITFCNV